MARSFWIIAAVFIAIATHAGFILLVPSYSLDRTIARLAVDAGTNAFFILPQDEQVNLLPALPRQSVVGVCAFDVSGSDVSLSASLPEGFWTLTIYSNRGDVIYSVNNTQTGTNTFTVGLSLAPDLLEMLRQATEKEPLDVDTGWTVSSPAARGLAVLWYPVSEAAARAGIMRDVSRTVCQTSNER
jgi:uncharacterized membrane protein